MAFKAHNVSMQHWGTKANELGVLEVRFCDPQQHRMHAARHNIPCGLQMPGSLCEAANPPETLRRHRRLCGSSVTI